MSLHEALASNGFVVAAVNTGLDRPNEYKYSDDQIHLITALSSNIRLFIKLAACSNSNPLASSSAIVWIYLSYEDDICLVFLFYSRSICVSSQFCYY